MWTVTEEPAGPAAARGGASAGGSAPAPAPSLAVVVEGFLCDGGSHGGDGCLLQLAVLLRRGRAVAAKHAAAAFSVASVAVAASEDRLGALGVVLLVFAVCEARGSGSECSSRYMTTPGLSLSRLGP